MKNVLSTLNKKIEGNGNKDNYICLYGAFVFIATGNATFF